MLLRPDEGTGDDQEYMDTDGSFPNDHSSDERIIHCLVMKI